MVQQKSSWVVIRYVYIYICAHHQPFFQNEIWAARQVSSAVHAQHVAAAARRAGAITKVHKIATRGKWKSHAERDILRLGRRACDVRVRLYYQETVVRDPKELVVIKHKNN